jgi:hypothetical protein
MNRNEKIARDHFATLAADLQKLGSPNIKYSESPYFGDYALTGTWPDIEIRLVRDRDVERVEVRPTRLTDDWFDIPLILLFLGEAESIEPLTPEEEMRLLARHLNKVLTEFALPKWNMTEQRLKSLQKQRAQTRFKLPPLS